MAQQQCDHLVLPLQAGHLNSRPATEQTTGVGKARETSATSKLDCHRRVHFSRWPVVYMYGSAHCSSGAYHSKMGSTQFTSAPSRIATRTWARGLSVCAWVRQRWALPPIEIRRQMGFGQQGLDVSGILKRAAATVADAARRAPHGLELALAGRFDQQAVWRDIPVHIGAHTGTAQVDKVQAAAQSQTRERT